MILLTTLNSKYIHTSLALYSLAAYCQDCGGKIEIEEFNINQNLEYILGEIYLRQPRIVGISTNIWNITLSLELVEDLKKVRPETIVILGGPEASVDFESILKRPHGPDYIILGEGEATLKELLTFLSDGEPERGKIKGLAFKAGEEVICTPPRPPLDLQTIPFPYPDLFAFQQRIVYYESSRGCPFRCAYCLSGWEDSNLRYLPVERVKTDLKRFIDAGIKIVKLIDRTFNFHPQRALEIMQFLAEQKGETEFHLEMVGELINPQILEILKTAPAGRFRVEIGVQSTCEAALKAVNRYHDLKKLQTNCLALAQSPGTTVHLDLIAGLPYEDIKKFARSFDWTFNLRPDELQLGFLKLLKGSTLRDEAEKYGYQYREAPPYEILSNRWLSFSDLLHLKVVEEMVEKYFNSQHFAFTLNRLFWDESRSPWQFFSSLARFWEDRGLYGRPHRQANYFNFLWQFLTKEVIKSRGEAEDLRSLLTLDFYLSGVGGREPRWLTPQSSLFREKIKANLRTEGVTGVSLPPSINPETLRRRMIVLVLSRHPRTKAEGLFPILIYTPAQGRPSWFLLSAEDLSLSDEEKRIILAEQEVVADD